MKFTLKRKNALKRANDKLSDRAMIHYWRALNDVIRHIDYKNILTAQGLLMVREGS